MSVFFSKSSGEKENNRLCILISNLTFNVFRVSGIDSWLKRHLKDAFNLPDNEQVFRCDSRPWTKTEKDSR